MGRFRPHGYIIKCYKNASRSNRYNFPTVNAINLLLSSRHSTPLHYRKKYSGALHQFFADATRSDTPWGSKPPHLQVGAFKSLQIHRDLVAIDVFSLLIFTLSITKIQLCKINAHFPLDCTIIARMPRMFALVEMLEIKLSNIETYLRHP